MAVKQGVRLLTYEVFMKRAHAMRALQKRAGGGKVCGVRMCACPSDEFSQSTLV
jgi:hypothetical protein